MVFVRCARVLCAYPIGPSRDIRVPLAEGRASYRRHYWAYKSYGVLPYTGYQPFSLSFRKCGVQIYTSLQAQVYIQELYCSTTALLRPPYLSVLVHRGHPSQEPEYLHLSTGRYRPPLHYKTLNRVQQSTSLSVLGSASKGGRLHPVD